METITNSQSRWASNSWLIIVILAGMLYVIGQVVAAWGQKSAAPGMQREIAVSGRGEVTIKPDIASITLGVTTGAQANAKQANDLLTSKFKLVVESVKALGVAENDIKTTNLSINPLYDYPEGRQVLKGFEATQQIEIKIRNLDSIGEIVSRSAADGVNQVGGITFTVDKPETVKTQAEAAAIADAREHAQELAKQLGVSLGRVKYYSVTTSDPGNPVPYYDLAAGGRGGSEMSVSQAPVPAGSQEVVANVTVTYELR